MLQRTELPPAKLSLILGQDLHHVAPKLVEQVSDEHGSMSVYTCSLSQKLITADNRMFPFTEETARSALSNTDSFVAATDDADEPMEDNLSYLPTTALLHSALQKEYPIAVPRGLAKDPRRCCYQPGHREFLQLSDSSFYLSLSLFFVSLSLYGSLSTYGSVRFADTLNGIYG